MLSALLPNRGCQNNVMKPLQLAYGCFMTLYIAEYDDAEQIVAVWVKEKSSRSPRVFDPTKDTFDPTRSAEFFGAPKREIEQWLISAHEREAVA